MVEDQSPNPLTGKPEPHVTPDGYPLGLRGLLNLGCTCYINSVVQVLLHAPGFTEYFLGGGHDSRLCPYIDCFVCEIDNLFQAAYSGERTPIPPSDLLQSIWKVEPEFADGGMHDAHDFWLLAAEALRKSRGGSRLVDGVFGGKLRTTTVCCHCGHTSSTVDQVLDLSLPLQRKQTPPEAPSRRTTESSSCHTTPPDASKSDHSREDAHSDSPEQSSSQTPVISSMLSSALAKRRRNFLPRCGECETCRNPRMKKGCLRNKKLRMIKRDPVNAYGERSQPPLGVRPSTELLIDHEDDTTLQKCLADFLEPEMLQDWMCEKCGKLQQARKTTKMEEVPMLLGIHLKRFAYNMGTGISRKLEMYVACPHDLDVSCLGMTQEEDASRTMIYRLSSIVAHDGSLNGGHYWCYMRKGETWYKINDGFVHGVDQSEVDACGAYMVFYVKAPQEDEPPPTPPKETKPFEGIL
ncbi:hypothetical protein BSKO_02946 [Bryopsis sp. KO-2023]|nr:hypothetical protein BSKO_02946 [Bryopsis sp. KO-2023]